MTNWCCEFCGQPRDRGEVCTHCPSCEVCGETKGEDEECDFCEYLAEAELEDAELSQEENELTLDHEPHFMNEEEYYEIHPGGITE